MIRLCLAAWLAAAEPWAAAQSPAPAPERWPLLNPAAAPFQPMGEPVAQILAKDRASSRLYLARAADGRSVTLTEVEHDSGGALDGITVTRVALPALAPEGASGSSVAADEANDYFGRPVSVAILLCRGVNQPCFQRERIALDSGRPEPLSAETFFKAHFDRAEPARAFLGALLRGR